VKAHGFTEAALDPVANVGAAERTGSGEADARGGGAVPREVERGEVSTGIALAGVINCSKIGGS
jgi:hypothetical protein